MIGQWTPPVNVVRVSMETLIKLHDLCDRWRRGYMSAEEYVYQALIIEPKLKPYQSNELKVMEPPRELIQMPRWRCHKEVLAVKIKAIQRPRMPVFQNSTCRGSILFGSACGHCERCEWERSGASQNTIIVPEGETPSFEVTSTYMSKHKPEVGGYFVVYKDGYQSFSPSEAFEDGYTRI